MEDKMIDIRKVLESITPGGHITEYSTGEVLDAATIYACTKEPPQVDFDTVRRTMRFLITLTGRTGDFGVFDEKMMPYLYREAIKSAFKKISGWPPESVENIRFSFASDELFVMRRGLRIISEAYHIKTEWEDKTNETV